LFIIPCSLFNIPIGQQRPVPETVLRSERGGEVKALHNFIIQHSLFIIPCSLFLVHYSIFRLVSNVPFRKTLLRSERGGEVKALLNFIIQHSLLIIQHSLLIIQYSDWSATSRSGDGAEK
jgi:hypothetical protein